MTNMLEYPKVVAAVDLGSNSFHMIVVRVNQGNLQVVDKLKEMVRLRGGLDEHKRLTEKSMARALSCLQRFGERLRHIPSSAVRVTGTNTLRTARNAEYFIRYAEKAIGHPIEIIAGHEEARLVYLGVAHSLSDDHGRRFVMDIGGGSTEFIIGKTFEPFKLESLNIGCVSMTQRLFPDGNLKREYWEKANTILRLEILPIQAQYRNQWDVATGSSGTIKTTRKITRELGLEKFGITLPALYVIRDKLIQCGSIAHINLPGLKNERVPVYPGGLAILMATFEALHIDRMVVSDGALREGLLYDMLGRIEHEDVRHRSIENLVERFSIDQGYAEHVQKTALALFDGLCETWSLVDHLRDLLNWAARVHELGLSITHNKYYLHGAYIIEHTDLSGFSNKEKRWLALLIRGHVKKPSQKCLETLPAQEQQAALYLTVILRLAVLLHRSHKYKAAILPKLNPKKNYLHLHFPFDLKEKALLHADLKREKKYLKNLSFDLLF